MGFFTKIRDLVEGSAAVVGNYLAPGSGAITSRLVSKGAQKELDSPLGKLAMVGSGLAGSIQNVGGLTGGAQTVSVAGAVTNALGTLTGNKSLSTLGSAMSLGSTAYGLSGFGTSAASEGPAPVFEAVGNTTGAPAVNLSVGTNTPDDVFGKVTGQTDTGGIQTQLPAAPAPASSTPPASGSVLNGGDTAGWQQNPTTGAYEQTPSQTSGSSAAKAMWEAVNKFAVDNPKISGAIAAAAVPAAFGFVSGIVPSHLKAAQTKAYESQSRLTDAQTAVANSVAAARAAPVPLLGAAPRPTPTYANGGGLINGRLVA